MYFSLVKHPVKLLKDPGLFFDFYIKHFLKILKYKMTGKKKQSGIISGHRIASYEDANRMIYEGLISDKPFVVGRNGGRETEFVIFERMIDLGAIDELDEMTMRTGKDSAGIFPLKKEAFSEFAKIYSKAVGAADITVYWGHILCESYALKKHFPCAQLIPSRPLEPFAFEKPWTRALEGKKALIVHPLEEAIKNQYLKRDKLFDRPDILPEFELKTLKAVQSLADEDCGFDSWADALKFMEMKISDMDFDIALLGCGGYSMPLAAHIKSLGKKAVVLGGLTQLLFGIKGSRWELSRPDIVAMYNDNWIRPNDSEKPKGYERTEGGAYW